MLYDDDEGLVEGMGGEGPGTFEAIETPAACGLVAGIARAGGLDIGVAEGGLVAAGGGGVDADAVEKRPKNPVAGGVLVELAPAPECRGELVAGLGACCGLD